MIEYTIDNLTVILLALITGLAVYHRFFTTPTPLVHPLLLGQQSAVSAVRKEGESGVYRNWATGQGAPFTVRPANSLKTTNDLVSTAVSASSAVPKCILDVSLSQEALAELIRVFPFGLSSLFNLPTTGASPRPIAVLLPPSPTTALPLLILQLAAAPSSPLIILPSPTLLTTALEPPSESHPVPGVLVVHVSLLDDVIEQAFEDLRDKLGILVVGKTDESHDALIGKATDKGMVVHWWEDVWTAAESAKHKITIPPAHFNDIHSYFYSAKESDTGDDAAPDIVKVTHLNITAGIAGVLAIFPPDKRPSAAARDIVASSIRLDTPIGMCIAMATIWLGAGFRFIGRSAAVWPTLVPARLEMEQQLQRLMASGLPPPTLIFTESAQLEAITTRLRSAFALHPLASIAAAHKMNALRGGDLSKTGLSEKLVWNPVRSRVLEGLTGDQLRGIVVVGDTPLVSTFAAAQTLLSIPISRIFASPLSTGPIFASHHYDTQSAGVHHSSLFNYKTQHEYEKESREKERCHTGPPATNVEILLKGPYSYVPEGMETSKISGNVWVRGPTVLEKVDGQPVEGWTDAGVHAEVQTNGTFLVSHRGYQSPIPTSYKAMDT